MPTLKPENMGARKRATTDAATPADQSAPNRNGAEAGDPAAIGNGHDPDAGKSTKETQDAMKKAVRAFARAGLEVFPVPPGTKKSHKKGKHSNGRPWGKTTSLKEINADFSKWPEANIGIAMGPDSGYFVIEVDTLQGHSVDGFASLQALEAIHGPLPETRTAISPSGSKHFYWNWPATGTIRNTASELGPGIDVRGEGGMVIAPPSLKPGVGAYKWDNRHAAVDLPEAWLALSP